MKIKTGTDTYNAVLESVAEAMMRGDVDRARQYAQTAAAVRDSMLTQTELLAGMEGLREVW